MARIPVALAGHEKLVDHAIGIVMLAVQICFGIYSEMLKISPTSPNLHRPGLEKSGRRLVLYLEPL